MATKLVRRVVPWTEAPPPGWPINRANKFGALVIDHAVPGTGSIALTPTGAPAQLLNITTSDDQLATGPYTLATELYWKNNTGTQYASVIGVFHVTSWPSFMDGVGIDWGSGTARKAEIRKNTDSQGAFSAAPAAGSVLPTEIVVSSTASAATAYEGSSSSSVSRIGTAGTFTTGKRRDINAGDGTSVFATRLVLFAAALTTEELLEYRADPWQIYDPRVFMVPVSAGGGSVSLIVADATHAHTADGLVLTSSTALSVAEATHAHAADNITLVVGSVLTVSEASHAHAADSPTLTAASALAVADATHSHAADNITLSVAGATNLTVADALHGHAADALALTSAHALIVADATHGHTVDGLTLTAASVLAIQEALHAHAADNITLDASGAVNLLLADGLHAHTADGVALTVAAWLTVADALHGHAADNVVLTFGGAVVEPLARYTIAAKARRLTITAAARRLEIRK